MEKIGIDEAAIDKQYQEIWWQQMRLEAREEAWEEEVAKGYAEGLAEGELRGTIKVYCHFIKEGKWTLEQAAANLNMSVGEFTQRAQGLAVL